MNEIVNAARRKVPCRSSKSAGLSQPTAMACRRHGTPIALSKTMKAAFVILLLSVTSAKLPAQCL
ncbi:MAG TPA: hypothetical protein PKC28_13820, partial [Bdellovibrionales bacterium]|nr:hypothetical protein [Bdellovibrionales bacterium]